MAMLKRIPGVERIFSFWVELWTLNSNLLLFIFTDRHGRAPVTAVASDPPGVSDPNLASDEDPYSHWVGSSPSDALMVGYRLQSSPCLYKETNFTSYTFSNSCCHYRSLKPYIRINFISHLSLVFINTKKKSESLTLCRGFQAHILAESIIHPQISICHNNFY